MINSMQVNPISGHWSEIKRLQNEMANMPKFSEMTKEENNKYRRMAIQIEQLRK